MRLVYTIFWTVQENGHSKWLGDACLTGDLPGWVEGVARCLENHWCLENSGLFISGKFK